jgi:hypothetical protein
MTSFTDNRYLFDPKMKLLFELLRNEPIGMTMIKSTTPPPTTAQRLAFDRAMRETLGALVTGYSVTVRSSAGGRILLSGRGGSEGICDVSVDAGLFLQSEWPELLMRGLRQKFQEKPRLAVVRPN